MLQHIDSADARYAYALIIEETSSEFFRPKTQNLVTKPVAPPGMSLKDNEQPTTNDEQPPLIAARPRYAKA